MNISEHHVRIIAIDPGTDNLGLCILDINTKTCNPIYARTHNIKVEKLISELDQLQCVFDLKFLKTYAIKRFFLSFLERTRPDMIACEQPFFHRFTPMAFGALSEVVVSLKLATHEYDNELSFITYPPKSVKKLIGAGATAKKPDMKNRLLSLTKYTSVLQEDNPVSAMSPDEVDAMCIAIIHAEANEIYFKELYHDFLQQ